MRQQRPADYRGYRNAGIRMTEELAPAAAHVGAPENRAALGAVHMYDQAHVVMLAERGLVPAGVGARILAGLRALDDAPGGAAEARARIGGGVHSGEYYLIRTLGEEVGGWDHLGRSTLCLASVSRRILQRDGLLDVLDALIGLRGTLLDLAVEHAGSVLPGYFQTQLSQPVSYGHFLLGAAQGFARHAERIRQTYARVNLNPGGGVMLTGTAVPIDRSRVAELLGFDGVVENATDAMDSNDTAVECFAVLAMLAQQIERLTAQLERWISSENEQLDLADRYRLSSSLAMNMRTPALPGRAILMTHVGELVKAFSAAGNLGAVNPDMALTGMGAILRGYGPVLRAIAFDPVRSADTLATIGYPGGTDLGVLMVQQAGVSWRTAHQIGGILFRFCDERGVRPAGIDGALLDEAAEEYFGRKLGLTTAAIQEAMDPHAIVRSRANLGGSSPDQVRQSANRLGQGLAEDLAWMVARRASVAGAATVLDAAMRSVEEETAAPAGNRDVAEAVT